MTVRELKEALNEYHDDLEVVVSKDAEGNGFEWLGALEIAYDVELWDADLTTALVLWP